MDMVVSSECDTDTRASCLPLARQVSQWATAGGGGGEARNFLVSLLSFHVAFALVAAGSRGETRRELLGFLGSESLDELCRAAATVLLGTLRDVPQVAAFACGVLVDRSRALVGAAAASRYAAVAKSADFFSELEQASGGTDTVARRAEQWAARNMEKSGWERDDKWVQCVIEWDGGRLARAKVSIRKYVSFRMLESGPNASSDVHNGIFQSRKQL
jgi:serpin B